MISNFNMDNYKKFVTPSAGFILINKPSGPTSHDIINRLRRLTDIKRIGHAGTLDPFASGVLIVAVGREATKKISQFVKMGKEYAATLFLGVQTDTYDREGKIINQSSIDDSRLAIDEIKKTLNSFVGKQQQVPPMFSAKKFKGKKLYQLARKGIEIKRKPADIEIYYIDLVSYDYPVLKIKTNCSSGTYVRTLAHDIGKKLGTGAYLEELERTAIGCYTIAKTIKISEITEENWHNYLINL